MEAFLLDISGSGLQLRLPQPVPCGAAVKIEANNTLILGEICRCEPEGAAYAAGVQLCHALSSLDEMEQPNRSLVGEGEANVESASEPRISRR